MKRILYYSLMTLAVVSCKEQEAPKRKYVDVAGIDNSIKPGDNFFRYVNGTWYDTAKIANDQVGVGSYSFLNIPQKLLLQNILEEASKSTNADGSIEQKVGDFYASGMDTTGINQRGFEPIKAMLARIEGIRDRSALMNFVADELKVGDYSIIAFDVSPDNDNSSINIAHFGQAGIGLPDRDYYFKNDSSTLAIQSAYKKYIATLFQLTGDAPDKASKNAEITYDIEKQLAASHKTRIETRDVKGNYHNLPVAGINKRHANIGWVDLLKNLGLDTDTVDIPQPS
jgi:putative endopeptidase